MVSKVGSKVGHLSERMGPSPDGIRECPVYMKTGVCKGVGSSSSHLSPSARPSSPGKSLLGEIGTVPPRVLFPSVIRQGGPLGAGRRAGGDHLQSSQGYGQDFAVWRPTLLEAAPFPPLVLC